MVPRCDRTAVHEASDRHRRAPSRPARRVLSPCRCYACEPGDCVLLVPSIQTLRPAVSPPAVLAILWLLVVVPPAAAQRPPAWAGSAYAPSGHQRGLPATSAASAASRVAIAAVETPPPPPTVDPLLAAAAWAVAQLVPSPLFSVGNASVGGGLRWQLTPLLFAFGLLEHHLRAFVIPPVARHAGAVELFIAPEWVCCAPRGMSNWVGRAGARLYWPLARRGEHLAASLAGSYFATPRAPRTHGGSIEVGLYTLASIVGLTMTFSPALPGREFILALSLRLYG